MYRDSTFKPPDAERSENRTLRVEHEVVIDELDAALGRWFERVRLHVIRVARTEGIEAAKADLELLVDAAATDLALNPAASVELQGRFARFMVTSVLANLVA